MAKLCVFRQLCEAVPVSALPVPNRTVTIHLLTVRADWTDVIISVIIIVAAGQLDRYIYNCQSRVQYGIVINMICSCIY